ncbi:Lsb5p KNAG_0C00460 [Huiozyma naganishii CBS 8797]|uniref:VHS domain-containing protein n=1 Tax=Huiozyma naganishii (strain ATCC MYA-139 / BCRC 22969 / CBS 8797 / KCTC 17520 / NBRC 10181 / NCYC 3082 / Yp74L-3) TaxID=1071383 RepID=J7R2W0_HUIN7|nr:hypothetical protein KNAG_0C00460 [Kazachstania naganishii CBS 8797]CCK69160.1 hypothetical protein KNAG_0C00460 [Kazachstania naganishii CBS 8797]
MGFWSSHQHSAITDTVDRIVSSQKYPLEVELDNLVNLIRESSDYEYTMNQEECAIVLRKKLKYGNKVQQSRSLDLLDLFISQGLKFGTMYNDEKLLDRLDVIANNKDTNGKGVVYNKKIISKAVKYIMDWNAYIVDMGAESSRTYEGIVRLKDTLGTGSSSSRSKRTPDIDRQRLNKGGPDMDRDRQRSRRRANQRRHRGGSNFMDDVADDSVFRAPQDPDSLYRIPQIDLKKHAPKIKMVISDALAAAVSLDNALMVLPENKNALTDKDTTSKFIQARAIRRKVLRYLQLVTEGEFLGSLIHANDELVKALTKYDERTQGEDDDESSDLSEDDSDFSDDDEPSSSGGFRSDEAGSDDPFADNHRI